MDPEIISAAFFGGVQLDGEPNYVTIAKRTRPEKTEYCKCGMRMLWDRMDSEWYCLCGKRKGN